MNDWDLKGVVLVVPKALRDSWDTKFEISNNTLDSKTLDILDNKNNGQLRIAHARGLMHALQQFRYLVTQFRDKMNFISKRFALSDKIRISSHISFI